jgi:ribonuclease PH
MLELFQHLYPKSQIDVHVTVLEDSGSVLASVLTCAGLALADASIHMFDCIVGASLVSCTVLFQEKNYQYFTLRA